MKGLARRLASVLGVRRGEGARVASLLAYSLCNGIFCAFFLTAANALFLARFEITFLPLAYIAASVVGYLAVALFSQLERLVSVAVLLVANLVALVALSGAFWFLAKTSENEWVVFAMFVFVGPMFSLVALGYWGLAGRLFDLRQGKRLFGLVGAGEEVSTIIGLFSIPVMLRALGGPLPLLLVATVGLVGSLAVVVVMMGSYRVTLAAGAEEPAKGEKQASAGLADLVKVRFFLLLAASVILLNLALYSVDFAFLAQIRVKFEGPAQIARFIGLFFGAAKVVELIMKVAVSGRLLSQFGLGVGLQVLPVLLAISAGLALLSASLGLGVANFFVVVALAKLVAVVARTSAFEPAFRVLYQPVPAVDRLAYQSHVEGTAKQLAVGATGFALLYLSRGQTFAALGLFYVLIPIVILWAVVNVFAHREYRAKLMENLAAGAAGGGVIGPVEALTPALRAAEPADRAVGFALLERIAPAEVETVVRSLLADPSPPVRLAALQVVTRHRLADFRAEVDALREDQDPAVWTAARLCRERLAELAELVGNPGRLDELARSTTEQDRVLAATAIGRGSGADADRLSVLLWDREPAVRKAALEAAGRLGNPELWPLLISQLAVPAYAPVAAAALTRIGQPVVGEIGRAFAKTDLDPAARYRSLAICEGIGGIEATSLLVGKLGFPDRSLRRRALAALARLGHRVEASEVPTVERAVEEVVRTTAWNLAMLVDLGDQPEVAELRGALEEEIEEDRAHLFDLLSLLYDPGAIEIVKENLASGSPRATVYALEIMDLLLVPWLKPIVFPLLEDQTHGQTLKRLEGLVPRQRLEPPAVLGAIVNREFDRLGLYTRVLAMETLGKVTPGVARDLVAALFHPEPVVQEVAAIAVASRDRATYEAHRKRLPVATRERLDAVVGPADGAELREDRSVLGRVRLLRSISTFAELSSASLMNLAIASEDRQLREGQRLPNPREPHESFQVLLEGELSVAGAVADGAPPQLPRHTLIGILHGGRAVEAVTTCRLVRIEPTRLFELASENAGLIPGLVEACRLLHAEEAVA